MGGGGGGGGGGTKLSHPQLIMHIVLKYNKYPSIPNDGPKTFKLKNLMCLQKIRHDTNLAQLKHKN